MSKPSEYKLHPKVVNLIPPMEAHERAALKADIKARGRLLSPVWLFEGKVVDGWNRYQIARELGLTPDYKAWRGQPSQLADFVIAQNVTRRHLSSSQRAVIAMRLLPSLRNDAAERKQKGKRGDGVPQTSGEARDRHAGEAAQQAAERTGTNRQYVEQAERLGRLDPDRLKKVWAGEMSLPQATQELNAALAQLKANSPKLHAQVESGDATVTQALARVRRRRTPAPVPDAPLAGRKAAEKAKAQPPADRPPVEVPSLEAAWDEADDPRARLRFLGRPDVSRLAAELLDVPATISPYLNRETRWVSLKGAKRALAAWCERGGQSDFIRKTNEFVLGRPGQKAFTVPAWTVWIDGKQYEVWPLGAFVPGEEAK